MNHPGQNGSWWWPGFNVDGVWSGSDSDSSMALADDNDYDDDSMGDNNLLTTMAVGNGAWTGGIDDSQNIDDDDDDDDFQLPDAEEWEAFKRHILDTVSARSSPGRRPGLYKRLPLSSSCRCCRVSRGGRFHRYPLFDRCFAVGDPRFPAGQLPSIPLAGGSSKSQWGKIVHAESSKPPAAVRGAFVRNPPVIGQSASGQSQGVVVEASQPSRRL